MSKLYILTIPYIMAAKSSKNSVVAVITLDGLLFFLPHDREMEKPGVGWI